MFSSNHRVNFRQKIVVIIGFQLSCMLLLNAYCATEYANDLYAEMKEDAEKGIPLSVAIKIARSMEKDWEEDTLPEGWTYDPCARKLEYDHAVQETIPLNVREICFMDPIDISRANIPQKFKDGKYLLFIDEQKNVMYFNLSLPAYDTEYQQARIKEWLDE